MDVCLDRFQVTLAGNGLRLQLGVIRRVIFDSSDQLDSDDYRVCGRIYLAPHIFAQRA